MNSWKYYNHALISGLAPHETPNVECLNEQKIWRKVGKEALFARWTTEFDRQAETQWWYVIKDTPFVLSELKAKRRYEINKGVKNFDVRCIEPREYRDELYEVQIAAYSVYPEKYRPKIDKESFMKSIDNWTKFEVFGAFEKETNKFCGYSFLEKIGENYIKFAVQKTMPEFEKLALNAALVYGILENYAGFLRDGGYICDGERSISHETKFQDYLEKYFGFRKAYCRLNLKYRPGISWIIKLMYPFRRLLLRFDDISVIHNLNSTLKMEEISRACCESR